MDSNIWIANDKTDKGQILTIPCVRIVVASN